MAEKLNGNDAPLAGVQQELISAHFLLLRRVLLKSARTDFQGFMPQNQMERRVIFTLFRMEESRVSELAYSMGNDVAQISRALASLRNVGMVHRERQRDPYTLTAKGLKFGQELDAVAEKREQRLIRGLQPVEAFELGGMLMSLQNRASQILAEELLQAKTEDAGEEGITVPAYPDPPNRVQAAVFNIANTISRSATAAFKRLAGVSNFEWRVLVNVASRPSITFMGIVDHVDADKAQVSRTLDALVGVGLICRAKDAASGQVLIELTEKGQAYYALMRDDALKRHTILTAGLKNAQRGRLQGYLNLLIGNALEMAGMSGEQEDRHGL
ncbi:hypothetical protein SZ64_09600 [Erythrobacter sp. SG61-1L]|uniref:hypothetical protein n=1 Tax=Erythrobacter sp. SG61-1L TaxID=1603897 RepID=UPI0006C8F641|nr:hypothetical protein [Erythrobacter sp. SG61-1L]KPL68351.1 hypothetical protein SZ64_09600 [Erythrobacter sp. SG61-1L]